MFGIELGDFGGEEVGGLVRILGQFARENRLAEDDLDAPPVVPEVEEYPEVLVGLVPLANPAAGVAPVADAGGNDVHGVSDLRGGCLGDTRSACAQGSHDAVHVSVTLG